MAAPIMQVFVSISACLGHRDCFPVHVPQVLNSTQTTGPVLPTSHLWSSLLCLPSKALVWRGQTTLRPWCLWLDEVSQL